MCSRFHPYNSTVLHLLFYQPLLYLFGKTVLAPNIVPVFLCYLFDCGERPLTWNTCPGSFLKKCFLCMCVYLAVCMYLYYLHAGAFSSQKRHQIRSPWTGVTDNCYQLHGFWEPSCTSLLELHVFLPAKPCLSFSASWMLVVHVYATIPSFTVFLAAVIRILLRIFFNFYQPTHYFNLPFCCWPWIYILLQSPEW